MHIEHWLFMYMIAKRINILAPHLANQIAAGEVVERPSSVVKEIIENSLDAGATSLDIVIEQGGIKFIRVRDNGHGILKDDLPLALRRHATSKISNAEDLYCIKSLGFRGEALASIGSVARVNLTSRAAGDNSSWQINVAGDDAANDDLAASIIPAAHPHGTTIEIHDLFFNVPARRKFLRTPQTEFSHVLEMVRRLALARFDVALRLQHNAKSILNFDAADSQGEQEKRLALICGEDFVSHAINVVGEAADIKIKGWIGLPSFTRSQPDLQYFYVNGRIVRDKTLAHAVRQAYQDVLPTQRHPVLVLYLDLEPTLVDVNVHPTKSEVRFRESNLVHDFVTKVIKKALGRVGRIDIEQAQSNEGTVAATAAFADPFAMVPAEINAAPQRQSFDVNVAEPAVEYANLAQRQRQSQSPQWLDSQPQLQSQLQPPLSVSLQPQLQVQRPQPAQPQLPLSSLSEASEQCPARTGFVAPSLGVAFGQVQNNYIIAQNDKGLILVDAHAAHERITYEKLKAAFWGEAVARQNLLQPMSFAVTPQEAEYAEMYGEIFGRLGLDVMRSGPTTIMVKCIPVLLCDADIEKLVRDVLADLIFAGVSFGMEQGINKILATMSCHSSVRAGRSLSVVEMNALLRQIEATDNGGQCGHGRPTWVQITIPELKKMFGRS
jgi:DNA mismatch repair protein MutL